MEVLEAIGKICTSFIFAVVSSWLANSIRDFKNPGLLIIFETMTGFWTLMVCLCLINLFIVI